MGDCGHVVVTWPLVSDIGGRNPTVICETCTIAAHGIIEPETVFVWVPLRPSPKPVTEPKPKKPRKVKPLSPWQTLLQEEGLF